MTDITYTYEIILVDEAARCMEVVYTSPVYGTQHVGARLPYEGETLEQIIAMYSPVAMWRLMDVPVQVPAVGLTGEMVDALPEPVPVDPIELYRAAVQAHIDATAQARGYDSGVSAASYAGDPNPAWAAEAAAFIAWRSAVWVAVFAALADVQAGTAPMPETPEALIAMLPQIEWP